MGFSAMSVAPGHGCDHVITIAVEYTPLPAALVLPLCYPCANPCLAVLLKVLQLPSTDFNPSIPLALFTQHLACKWPYCYRMHDAYLCAHPT
jgi:hypothetical protein